MNMSILAMALLSSATLVSAAPILEDIVAKNVPINPDARISIRNDDGAIWIYGADTGEAKIQAIKKAYSRERLDAIKIDIVTTPQSLSIETKYPPKPRWSLRDRSGTVDYVVVVPWTCTIERADLANGEVLIDGLREASVHARLSNGRMFVHNCFGDVHAQVTNGGLDVAFEWWEQHKFSIDAKIINGNAHAVLPGEAIFHLLATSVNGAVVSDFLGEQDRQRGGVPKIDISMPGEPQAEMHLQAVNGSIQIAETKF